MRSFAIGIVLAGGISDGASAATCAEEFRAMGSRVTQLTKLTNEVKALYTPTPCTAKVSADQFIRLQNERLAILHINKSKRPFLSACPGVTSGDPPDFEDKEIKKAQNSINLCKKVPKK